MSISRMGISEKKRLWKDRGGIPGLLYSKNSLNKPTSCTYKRQYSFNLALAAASLMAYEKGIITLDIYFCDHCFRYHIGNNSRLASKEYCVWCGAWIRKSRLQKHNLRCKYKEQDE